MSIEMGKLRFVVLAFVVCALAGCSTEEGTDADTPPGENPDPITTVTTEAPPAEKPTEKPTETPGVEAETTANPVHRSLLLSRVAAAVGVTAGYSAVYWDAATMVHPASAFDSAVAAMAPGDLPVKLWVHFRTVDEPDGSRSLSTVGLEALGHREIEVWGAQAAVEEILGWSYNVAHYLLSESPTIEDGQAIATDRTRWVHVFLRPSMLDPERTVYCLVLDPDSAPREDPQAR